MYFFARRRNNPLPDCWISGFEDKCLGLKGVNLPDTLQSLSFDVDFELQRVRVALPETLSMLGCNDAVVSCLRSESARE